MSIKVVMTALMLAYACVFTYVGWRAGRDDPSFCRTFIGFVWLSATIVLIGVWLTGGAIGGEE